MWFISQSVRSEEGLAVPQLFPQLPSVIESLMNNARGPPAMADSVMNKISVTKVIILFIIISVLIIFIYGYGGLDQWS